MSKPFFIWTMRRTGGTSLTDLLMEMSEYKKIEHEPFLWERELGFVTKEFRRQLDADDHIDIVPVLEEVFAEQPLIKHCYEVFHIDLSRNLIRFLKNRDYKHIFLLRKDEVSRIFSLLLAYQTDVWGKHGSEEAYDRIQSGEQRLEPFDIELLKKEEQTAINHTRKIKNILKNNDLPYKMIYFEDLYTGNEEKRKENLYDLFDYLEFDQEVIESHQEMINEILFQRSQKSNSILPYVPNLKEAEDVLKKVIDDAL